MIVIKKNYTHKNCGIQIQTKAFGKLPYHFDVDKDSLSIN